MNHKENQYVGSSKWLLLIGLVVLVLMLVVAPVGQHGSEAQIVRAKQNAEVLGLQLVQALGHNSQSSGSRSPASAEDGQTFKGEGYIGLDPWGQPYKYNVLKTDQGIARVVITSDGPPLQNGEKSNNQNTEKIKVVISPGE